MATLSTVLELKWPASFITYSVREKNTRRPVITGWVLICWSVYCSPTLWSKLIRQRYYGVLCYSCLDHNISAPWLQRVCVCVCVGIQWEKLWAKEKPGRSAAIAHGKHKSAFLPQRNRNLRSPRSKGPARFPRDEASHQVFVPAVAARIKARFTYMGVYCSFAAGTLTQALVMCWLMVMPSYCLGSHLASPLWRKTLSPASDRWYVICFNQRVFFFFHFAFRALFFCLFPILNRC